MGNTITRTYPKRISTRFYRDNDIIGGLNKNEWVNAPTTSYSDVKTSTNNPKWRDQVARHQNATTGREIDLLNIRALGYGDVRARFLKLGPRYSIARGLLMPPIYPGLPTNTANADYQARSRFFKRAKEAQTAFRGLTFLGELTETLRMLKRPGQGLRKGLDDYLTNVTKRSRRAKRSSLPGIVSDTWLEHVFGWQPLLSDIRDAGTALNTNRDRLAGSYTRISGKGMEESASFSGPLDNSGFGYGLRYTYRRLTTDIVSVRYYGEVGAVCDNPIEANTDLFGVSWGDVVPSVWELIPYSFLVDYFSNIGDVLDAWSVRRAMFTWCARSTRRSRAISVRDWKMDWAYTQSSIGISGWIEQYAALSPSSVTRVYIKRETASPALPEFRFEIPGMGTKWINMSALLLSRNSARRQIFT